MFFRCLPVMLALLWAMPAAAAQPAQLPALLQCLSENVPQQLRFKLILKTRDAAGEAALRGANVALLRQGDALQARLYVTEPADLVGSAYLLRRDASGVRTWSYLPGLQAPRELRGGRKQRLLGSALTLDDLSYLAGGLPGGSLVLGREGEVQGRPSRRLIALAAPDANGPYSKVEVDVGTAPCALLAARFYLGREALRQLSASSDLLLDSGGFHYAPRVRVENLPDGPVTEVQIHDLRRDVRLPASLFAPDTFFRATP